MKWYAEQYRNDHPDLERGYVRFGKLPNHGISVNHSTGEPERGVSCFEAEFTGNEYKPLLTGYLCSVYEQVKGRTAYRLYGKVVGTGSDGEPVLRVRQAVRITK
jgi:hypothetical protein